MYCGGRFVPVLLEFHFIVSTHIETVVLLSKKFDESKIFFDVGVGLRTTTGSRTGRRAKEIRKSMPFPARRIMMTDSQISKPEEKPMLYHASSQLREL